MVRLKRRSVRVAIAVVVIGIVMAAVSTVPTGDEPPPAPPGPTVALRSSTRGSVAVPVDAGAVGGVPSHPAVLRPTDDAVAARPAGTAPAGSGGESVIGQDGRTDLIGQTARYPNAAIGRVDFRQGGNSYWCTGTLISADIVLTAGHCVHDGLTATMGWSTQVRFSPAAEGNRAPFGSCPATELLAFPGWYGGGGEVHDLGMIRLGCTIGDTVGWFGFRSVPDAGDLTGATVHVRGYPGDQRWSTLWTMRDRIRVSRRLSVFYAADTYGGQSGSPVFANGACNGTRGPCIVAVHAYGVHPGPDAAHARFNHGPRLTPARSAVLVTLTQG